MTARVFTFPTPTVLPYRAHLTRPDHGTTDWTCWVIENQLEAVAETGDDALYLALCLTDPGRVQLVADAVDTLIDLAFEVAEQRCRALHAERTTLVEREYKAALIGLARIVRGAA